MKGLGKVTTVLMIAAVVAAVGIRSIPDVRRYAEIRRM